MPETLILTNHDDVSINYLIEKLDRASISSLRINSEDINKFEFDVNPGESFSFFYKDQLIDLKRSKSVIFRRIPLKYNKGQEGDDHKYLNLERKHFWEGLFLSLDHCKWINPMFGTQIAERKLYQLQIAKRLGLLVPKTIITNNRESALNFLKNCSSSIIKPISNGLQVINDKVFSIYTTEISYQSFNQMNITSIFDTPVFLQEKIQNKGDIRVTIVGSTLYAVKITKDGDDVDWRKPNLKKNYSIIDLPSKIQDKLLLLNKTFGLVYSAIDLILTPKGDYIFLEVNPVGEWVWLEHELGIDISTKLINELK